MNRALVIAVLLIGCGQPIATEEAATPYVFKTDYYLEQPVMTVNSGTNFIFSIDWKGEVRLGVTNISEASKAFWDEVMKMNLCEYCRTNKP